MAAEVVVPSLFQNGKITDGPAMSADFAAIVNWLNTNAVHIDAAKAFTALPSANVSVGNITATTHLTTKAYVDSLVSARVLQSTASAVFPQYPSVTGLYMFKTGFGSQAARDANITVEGEPAYWNFTHTYFDGTLNKNMRVWCGTQSVTIAAGAGASTGFTINAFNTGIMATPPIVYVQAYNSVSNARAYSVKVTSVTTGAINLTITDVDPTFAGGSFATVNVIAVEGSL